MVEVRAVIFCDEVRREHDGRLLVVGMYGGPIETDFPWNRNVTALLVIEGIEDHNSAVVQYRSRSEAAFATLDVEMEHIPGTTKHTAYLPLPPVPIMLSSPDVLEIRVSIDEGEVVVVGQLHVEAAK